MIVGLFACLMLGSAVYEAASVATLRQRGLTARAEVVAVHGGKSGYVVVTFRPGGGAPVEATVDDDDWAGWPSVNDVQTVVYDPRNPTGKVVDARVGPDYDNALFIGLLGAVLAGLGWLSFAGVIDISDWPRR